MIKQTELDSTFKPSLSPEEMFKLGVFGGGYWRPINSKVTNLYYKDDYKEFEWTKNIPLKLLTSVDYDPKINAYGVKCGTDLEFWESKNWIHEQDPRGWVQWYCRYYEGRRTKDDARQIKRWKRIERFKRMLKVHPHSKKLKQVLLHWAIDPQEDSI